MWSSDIVIHKLATSANAQRHVECICVISMYMLPGHIDCFIVDDIIMLFSRKYGA